MSMAESSGQLVTHVLIADHASARLLRIVEPKEGEHQRRVVEQEEKLDESTHRHDDTHRHPERFVARIAQHLASRHRAGALSSLVVIADPHLLGTIRQHWPAELRKLISREISGDYTHADQRQVLRLIEPPAPR